MRLLFPALILLIAAGALAIRLPHLADRPLHNDEAVLADKFRETLEHGTLRYDPRQYHGPAFWFLTLPSAWLSSHSDWIGLTEFNYRIVSVVCGVGVVLALALMRDALGFSGAIWAGLLLALSPAMVYYSRDYIHEMMLVMFTALAIACGWRWSRSGHVAWAIGCGAAMGLMLATKETTFIIVAAMMAGLLLAVIWQKWGEREPIQLQKSLRAWHLLAALAVGLVITLLMYSSFLRDLPGLKRAASFVQIYLSRAAGETGHVQSSRYYLKILLYNRLTPPSPTNSAFGLTPKLTTQSDGLTASVAITTRVGILSEALIVVLACIGTIVILFFNRTVSQAEQSDQPNRVFGRFLVFYTFVVFSVFSLISYKTPWNVLSPLYGMTLLAGIGAAAMVRAIGRVMWKAPFIALLLIGVAQLGIQAYAASNRYATDTHNPYVYSQTTPDAMKLVDLMDTLARLSPEGHQMGVLIGTDESPWPLPWYLRQFQQVGYYETAPPWLAALRPSVVIVSSDLAAGLDAKYLDTKLYEQTNSRGLRPGVVLQVYLRKDLWSALIAERSRLHAATTQK